MDEAKSIEILLEHGIRPTANRLLLVKVLSKAEHPLHLVHVLQDGADAVRYELCHSHEEDHDDDLHAHFYCERCRQTFCLNDIPVPLVDLPKGYRMNTINYLIKGICPNCQ